MTYRVRKPLQVMHDEPPKPLSFVEIKPGSIITVATWDSKVSRC